MSIGLEQTRIDPAAPQFKQMFENLQCNILKSHGREHAVHILLEFTGSAKDVRGWIKKLANTHVTSAADQQGQVLEFNKLRSEGRTSAGELIGAFFLSAEGYKYLGFKVGKFHDNDDTFRAGMKHKDLDLLDRIIFDRNNKDPEPPEWEAEYQRDIHAMILLAHDDLDTLKKAVRTVATRAKKVANVLKQEWGEVARTKPIPPNLKGLPKEHFGYVDGRSNPVFLKADIAREKERGTRTWHPEANLDLVLVPDPYSKVEDSFGSYFVFRKLEQNVAGFKLAISALANKVGIDESLAGAFCVGRFRDGTPVALRGSDGLGDVNDFEYKSDDGSGSKCPAHAHTRKVNPRGTTPFMSLESERKHRIVRRGIPYGTVDDQNPPSEGVGLLFMCYQSDMSLQFEFIQRTWSDNPNFPRNIVLPKTGDDPLIGQDDDGRAAQDWPTSWESSKRKRVNFGGYVTLKGGEYFFAPSMSFLRKITEL